MARNVIKVAFAAMAGFIAGILMAPKSGKETREDIKKKAGEAKVYAEKKAKQAKSAAKDSYKSLKHGANDIGEEVSRFSRHTQMSAKKLAGEAKVRGTHVIDEAERTGKRIKEDIKQNFK